MPTWTMEERSRLLLTIIELLAPPKSTVKMPPWPVVAEKMNSGFSGEAVRQQYQKLRKEGLPGGRKTLRRPHKLGITGIKPDVHTDDEEVDLWEDDESLIRKKIKKEHRVQQELAYQQAYDYEVACGGEVDEDEGLIKGYNLRKVKNEMMAQQNGWVKGEGEEDEEDEIMESADEEDDDEFVPEPVPVKREGLGKDGGDLSE
ncbi:hypothetical protein BJ508DRAFT_323824 [Ascobolus immersus RN42]|uniref:Myb-like domain-containing protein n=1 Tax=Ascobolus immersus RN42 TaxID=1160509 RepID=A0A3N4IEG9_ASCIM|nr:hypothetical protein BJ508DRAFT_323824 [Ascobolus immersus RN42]